MPYITVESGALSDEQKEGLIKQLTEVPSKIMKVLDGGEFMKRIAALSIMLICMTGLTACAKDNANTLNTSAQDIMEEAHSTEKIHDDIAAENIHYVNVSGNARSIVIRQSENKYFEFYNGDLDADHTYKVHCDENGDTIDINIMMENAEEDNSILGSVIIDIPQKEFEKIEVTGDFSQIYLYTINSDVLIHANDAFVNLDLEAEQLEHNITLGGSESNVFRGVSVYLDRFPDDVRMELNLIQGGTINDPENILKENGLEAGSGKPVISINNTKEINVYRIE